VNIKGNSIGNDGLRYLSKSLTLNDSLVSLNLENN